MGKTFKDNKMVLKGGYIKVGIDNIHDYNQNVNRGAGKHKAKKGNGSYNRKPKHKGSYSFDY